MGINYALWSIKDQRRVKRQICYSNNKRKSFEWTCLLKAESCKWLFFIVLMPDVFPDFSFETLMNVSDFLPSHFGYFPTKFCWILGDNLIFAHTSYIYILFVYPILSFSLPGSKPMINFYFLWHFYSSHEYKC